MLDESSRPKPVQEGFVRLVDVMGSDASVIFSARVSYGEESKGMERDKKLIHYMWKNNHGTPFEHIAYTFHVKCPIFVARQWFRHRMGSFNEISGRYVQIDTQFWKPAEWRENNKQNKQSSGVGDFSIQEEEDLRSLYDDSVAQAEKAYKQMLDMGVAREQARAILPLATYTEFYWSVNLRSLFNFLRLRTADDAQAEMREYAEAIQEIAQPHAPWSFEAFLQSVS